MYMDMRMAPMASIHQTLGTMIAKVAVAMAVRLEATSLQWSSARASMESEVCFRAVQRKYRMILASEPNPRMTYMAMDRCRSGSTPLHACMTHYETWKYCQSTSRVHAHVPQNFIV